MLVSSGVDAKSLVVPEAGHLALRPAYESNLRAYADGGRPGLRAWLLYCAEAYAAGAEASPLRGEWGAVGSGRGAARASGTRSLGCRRGHTDPATKRARTNGSPGSFPLTCAL